MLSGLRLHGFTLIELLIALAIGSFLVMLALPGFTTWIADTQVQAGAETVATGFRFALTEAIKRNQNVAVVLDNTSGTGGWVAQIAGPVDLQHGHFAEGAAKASFAVEPAGATTVTFSGIGQITPNDDGTSTITRVRVTSAVSGTRELDVVVVNQRVKVCDPAWPASDPRGCP
ncbi:MAG TPA: GspH/FimT family pseudopilin [Casimicrobiaceae bacterium]|jgi:type IV fimbrial biogenesis protein FimT